MIHGEVGGVNQSVTVTFFEQNFTTKALKKPFLCKMKNVTSFCGLRYGTIPNVTLVREGPKIIQKRYMKNYEVNNL